MEISAWFSSATTSYKLLPRFLLRTRAAIEVYLSFSGVSHFYSLIKTCLDPRNVSEEQIPWPGEYNEKTMQKKTNKTVSRRYWVKGASRRSGTISDERCYLSVVARDLGVPRPVPPSGGVSRGVIPR